MFTGLIREMATVKSFASSTLTLKASYTPKIGDSIAINGACLTVIRLSNDGFSVELSPESQAILAPNTYKGRVHIEPAMQMKDRFEGHVVQGHIDTTGKILSITKQKNSFDVVVSIDKKHHRYIIAKGSVTIDGVSLTINEVFSDSFRLTIIPHTMKESLFSTYSIGSIVNIETDMFARYIEHLLQKSTPSSLSWAEVETISAIY